MIIDCARVFIVQPISPDDTLFQLCLRGDQEMPIDEAYFDDNYEVIDSANSMDEIIRLAGEQHGVPTDFEIPVV